MAYGDVVAEPQLFDEEDIDFLKQFPDKYKPEALHQRYNLLKDMLKEREQNRKEKYNYESLKSQFRQKGNSELTAKKYAEKTISDQAKKNADVLVNEPSTHKFSFYDKINRDGKTSKDKNAKVIYARPHINRLIQKLETEPGEEFIPAIKPEMEKLGLKYGKYGHHLEGGYNFSNTPQVHKKAFDNWLLNNAHGHYGELPNEADWKEVEIADEKALEKLYVKAKSLVDPYTKDASGQNGRKKSKSQIVKEIDDKIVELIKSGEANKFLPAKSREMGAKFGVEIGKDGPSVITPNIFLPHQKSRANVDGQDQDHDEAILLKPHVLEKVKDAEGNLTYQPANKWRKGGDFDAGSGYNPNYNYAGKRHISKIDPKYNDAKNHLDRVLGTKKATYKIQHKKGGTPSISITDNQMHGEFYRDILTGIKQAIDNGEGGAGHGEKVQLVNSVEDLHQMILLQMYDSLGTKALMDAGQEGELARIAKARSFTGAYAQKNIADRGSRRQREKNQKMGIGGVKSFTSSNDDMDDSAVLDQISQSATNRQLFTKNQIIDTQKAAAQLAKRADMLKNSFKRSDDIDDIQDAADATSYRGQIVHSLMLVLINQYEQKGYSEDEARKMAADFSEKVSTNYNLSTEQITSIYNNEIDRLKNVDPSKVAADSQQKAIASSTEELENELERVGDEVSKSNLYLQSNPNVDPHVSTIINNKVKELEEIMAKAKEKGISIRPELFMAYKDVKNKLNPATPNAATPAASGQAPSKFGDYIKNGDWKSAAQALAHTQPTSKENLNKALAKYNTNLDVIISKIGVDPNLGYLKGILERKFR